MSKTDTILFDFDGTLMNTNDVIIDSWQHTFKTIEGRERPLEEIIKTFGEPLDITMKKFFPGYDTDKAIDIYRSHHRENFGPLISLFPGMKDLLAELWAREYRLGLVTSRLRKTTDQGLEKYGIKDFFDVVVTADDTTKHKPDPTPINIALAKLDSRPERSIMLGDTEFDILCARNAGVKSVLVSWAVAVSAKELDGENRPDYIIDEAKDLFKIIA